MTNLEVLDKIISYVKRHIEGHQWVSLDYYIMLDYLVIYHLEEIYFINGVFLYLINNDHCQIEYESQRYIILRITNDTVEELRMYRMRIAQYGVEMQQVSELERVLQI